MARKRYKMTPARRAALRKAQLASAKKRRRQKQIKRAAITAGVMGLTGASAAGVYGAKLLRGGPTEVVGSQYPSSRALGQRRPRGNPVNEHARTYDRKNKRWVRVPKGGVYKVAGGQFRPRARHVQRQRLAYDARRRAGVSK